MLIQIRNKNKHTFVKKKRNLTILYNNFKKIKPFFRALF
jgi:hypothetical protein